jgi:hypothetical protein
MSGTEIYTGTVEQAIIRTVDIATKQALGPMLLGEPEYELAFGEDRRDSFMDIGDGYQGGYSLLSVAVSVASQAAASSKKKGMITTVSVLQRLRVNNLDKPISVLYSGAFIKDTKMIFTTMSIGTVFDFGLPGGVKVSLDNNKVTANRIQVSGAGVGVPAPIVTAYELESQQKDSNLSVLLNRLPQISRYKEQGKVSRTAYRIEKGPVFSIVPRQGKTVVSVLTSALQPNTLGPTEGIVYPMDWGAKKPVEFEVCSPYVSNVVPALELIQRVAATPDHLKATGQPTAMIQGGVDVVLSLDIARELRNPTLDAVKLTDVIQKTPVAQSILVDLNSSYTDIFVGEEAFFPKYQLKKV